MAQKDIPNRLRQLRERMAKEGIAFVLLPTADYHNSEYCADFFQVRAFFSNFTGSNGTLLVTKKEALLWTDGRYFIQAKKELAETTVTLMRMGTEGVPEIERYIESHWEQGDVLAFDGRCVSAKEGRSFADMAEKKGGSLRFDFDAASGIWTDRPALPKSEMYTLSEKLTGETFAVRLKRVREALSKAHADALVLSKLDDIMWLTNLRGADIACNPVALSYLFLTMERCLLFVQEEEITDAVRTYAEEQGIILCDYHSFFEFLKETGDTKEIREEIREGLFYDERNVSYALYAQLQSLSDRSGVALLNGKNPTALMKAVKNETELTHTRETYLMDSVALTEFLYYVKTNAGKEEMTELSLAKRLDDMRASLPGFIELSFPTISAYGANAAMAHYEATEESFAKVEAKGLYLVDSGATYKTGTTDVTRTIVMGEITDEMKRHYTLVTVGMLRLAAAHFLYGCTGRNLDILARQLLWDAGIDYKHGTGHGIGFVLNVHEGPQNIRWQITKDMEEAVLEEGMIVSDEPGVYIAGSHGIRVENILEVVADVKNDDGRFLKFAHLTYAPIDLDAIDVRYMEQRDIRLLNDYHKEVFARVSPHLTDGNVRTWLKEATRAIG